MGMYQKGDILIASSEPIYVIKIIEKYYYIKSSKTRFRYKIKKLYPNNIRANVYSYVGNFKRHYKKINEFEKLLYL